MRARLSSHLDQGKALAIRHDSPFHRTKAEVFGLAQQVGAFIERAARWRPNLTHLGGGTPHFSRWRRRPLAPPGLQGTPGVPQSGGVEPSALPADVRVPTVGELAPKVRPETFGRMRNGTTPRTRRTSGERHATRPSPLRPASRIDRDGGRDACRNPIP